MELIEKLQKIIEREIDNVPMVLTDPLTLRRLRAERLAQAALTALIEHAGGDGVTQADRDAANLAFNVWDNTNELALAFGRHRQAAIKERDAEIERLREALRELVEEYVHNVDSTRLGGFYLDPETEDCVIDARAALKGSQQ